MHQQPANEFQQAFKGIEFPQPAQQLNNDLIGYMDKYRPQDPANPQDSRLVNSDIIESVFGQYKQLSATSSLQELGSMVLLLPLLVFDITADLVQQAMENVTHKTLSQWSLDTFGRSALARRIEAFSPKHGNMIVA